MKNRLTFFVLEIKTETNSKTRKENYLWKDTKDDPLISHYPSISSP